MLKEGDVIHHIQQSNQTVTHQDDNPQPKPMPAVPGTLLVTQC